jgi:hypothetical protein
VIEGLFRDRFAPLSSPTTLMFYNSHNTQLTCWFLRREPGEKPSWQGREQHIKQTQHTYGARAEVWTHNLWNHSGERRAFYRYATHHATHQLHSFTASQLHNLEVKQNIEYIRRNWAIGFWKRNHGYNHCCVVVLLCIHMQSVEYTRNRKWVGAKVTPMKQSNPPSSRISFKSVLFWSLVKLSYCPALFIITNWSFGCDNELDLIFLKET